MKTGTLLIFIFFVSLAYAQENSPVKLSWISAGGGLTLNSNFKADTTLYQSLATADDSLLHPDLDGYSRRRNFTLNPGGDLAFCAAFRMRKKNSSEYDFRKVVRFGFHFNVNRFVSTTFRQQESVRYDTINSSGEILYADSAFTREYRYRYSTAQAGLEAAILWNTDTAKLFGLYGGFSFNQFVSFGSTVRAEYVNRVRVEYSNTSGQLVNDEILKDENETLQRNNAVLPAKSAFITRIGIPAGVTLKLSRKIPVLRNVQLFFETQPYFEFTAIPGTDTFTGAGASWCGGVRILLSK